MDFTGRFKWNLRRRGWLALDLGLSAAAILAAHALQPRSDFGWTSSNPSQPGAWSAALIYPWLVLITGHVAGLHDPLSDRRRWVAFLRVCAAVVGALAMFLFLLYFTSLQQLGRVVLTRTLVISVVFLTAARVVVWGFAAEIQRRVGCYLSPPRDGRFKQLIATHHFTPCLLELPGDGLAWTPNAVADFFSRAGADEIVVSAQEGDARAQAIWLACLNRGLQVTDLAVFVEREYYKIPCDEIAVSWLLFIDLKWNHPFYHRLKRLLDVFAAIVLSVVLLPVFFAAALAVWVESGRPVLYTQIRTGFRGQPYRIIKLRTMRTDAEKSGAQWAAPGDDRTTRVGRVLRKTRIDELPQLWNVLRNEMSFIGPRPERPELVEKLTEEVPLFPQRHWVQPGITGWAQINYPYGASVEDAREKLCYDLYYIKNSSLLLDLHIALRTIGAVMKGSR
ncbi:MAG TPA: exopolysaccharide biosynthesis polyprenyl glycosylphosphotransferase [Opitutaceae bacterium]|jgi:lipopolysaccharide/colanic/teichoic acid biosynthesis glycosyltransferase|nr:exopolysaccharide biosynthesis polyprenyl glycosylphosphotransferase [Opitutaceae bacterium]